MMKFYNYISEKTDTFDRVFIRIGPGAGQKQIHRTAKQAPERKGVWLLPIQGSRDVVFLGAGVGTSDKKKGTHGSRISILKSDLPEYQELEKKLTAYWDNPGPKNMFSDPEYKAIQNRMSTIEMKRAKDHYKKFNLKSTEIVWCHIGKGAPDLEFGGWPWFKVTVSEYWDLFKREYAKQVGGLKKSGKEPYISPDWEYFEVFYPTT